MIVDQNTFVSPALVKIGRIIKGAVVGQMESVVMDKHKPLCMLAARNGEE
jgi:hypothetical protein